MNVSSVGYELDVDIGSKEKISTLTNMGLLISLLAHLGTLLFETVANDSFSVLSRPPSSCPSAYFKGGPVSHPNIICES